MYKALFLTFFLLQSCVWNYRRIDLKEARDLVWLDANDLATFSRLRQQLMNDSSAIIKQNKEASFANFTGWFSTNSYYLNQIDSVKYAILLSKLKGKFANEVLMNEAGEFIFTLKDNTQMNYDNYNNTYSHQLISANYNGSIKTVYNRIDSIYVDSIINNNWRYVFYKVLTGH